MAARKKYYVVWKGRKKGIYSTWDECAAQVSGYVGAQYMAFDSQEQAEAAARGRYWDYAGKPAARQGLLIAPPYEIASICVDAACSGNPGVLEYRGVETASGKELFHGGPFPEGTNNIGEFLAIVEALALLQGWHSLLMIYSDSQNAIAWVKARKCKTKLVRNSRSAGLFERIAWAEGWLAGNRYENPVLKWDTEAWGEIPADFGRK
jgi:ribonuclease HI